MNDAGIVRRFYLALYIYVCKEFVFRKEKRVFIKEIQLYICKKYMHLNAVKVSYM